MPNNVESDDAPEHIKKLRAEAEQAKTLQKELEAKERQIAFLQAGVDTSTKLGQMLMKTYDGEMTPEAIKAEAADIGLVESSEQVVVEEVTEEQTQYQQARNNLASGATARFEPDTLSAQDQAFDEYNNARREGLSTGDAQDLAFASFISNAANGNPTATFDEQAWREKSASYGHIGT